MIGAIIGDIADAQYAVLTVMADRTKRYLLQDMLEVVSKFEKQKL